MKMEKDLNELKQALFNIQRDITEVKKTLDREDPDKSQWARDIFGEALLLGLGVAGGVLTAIEATDGDNERESDCAVPDSTINKIISGVILYIKAGKEDIEELNKIVKIIIKNDSK